MADIRLLFEENEIALGDGVTTIGRTSDNAVSFPGDSNVSRYHAEIELRGGEYCLIDLNSSNGTAVNGKKVSGEVYLKIGDEIVLGGTSKIVFGSSDQNVPEAEPVAAPSVPVGEAVMAAAALPSASAAPPTASGGSNKLLLIAGAICCIAILFVVVAGAVYYFSGSSCSATARITSIEQGEAIDKLTDIEIDLKDGQCVTQAVYTVDGKPFAASQESPFSAKIDPKSFPDLTDGVDHDLGIILIDSEGNQMPQAAIVRVAFETSKITKTEPDVVITGPQPPGKVEPVGKEVSLIDLQQMTTSLAKQFAGGRSYNVSNPAFLQEVKKRTAEYAVPGYYERASKYRDAINVAYARENNLDAALGYMLAMSRSNFQPAKKGTFEGLWQMTPEFLAAGGYNGVCGTETLTDQTQNCAARASAVYMKALVLGVFEGDMIYSIAVFGKSTADAGVWKAALPKNNPDVWTAIKTAPERDQLVRFFAAGVVAENPQKFGLKSDLPLSELYKLTR